MIAFMPWWKKQSCRDRKGVSNCRGMMLRGEADYKGDTQGNSLGWSDGSLRYLSTQNYTFVKTHRKINFHYLKLKKQSIRNEIKQDFGEFSGTQTIVNQCNCIVNVWYSLAEGVRKKGADPNNYGKQVFFSLDFGRLMTKKKCTQTLHSS